MAGLPPGDPQLVSMIVSHLKTQGLFDQFRRECLADVDTKPAYLNLKQRVDNFVSNHLSNHTWSPHLNKNQLRNNIRQLVLQSGMLEQGVDRIVAQVVDPKINHIFRPQVERVVREFLSPGSCSEEPPDPVPSVESKPDSSVTEQASSSAPTTTAASDAMSILDTITSLNQEASVRAISEPEKGQKGSDDPMELEESEQDMGVIEEGVSQLEEEEKMATELDTLEVKTEDTQEQGEVIGKEELIGEVKMEEEESGDHEPKGDEKEKTTGKTPGKFSEEKQDDDQLKSPCQAKQKAKERMKEEYSLEDSDLEGLSDITVSSVHTSDLSSFEGQSDDEQLLSDSSEEGELPPDDKGEGAEMKHFSGDTGEEDKEFKPRRKAYVHKPFLYSRYYSDSDDEITVEERRRSAAKDKEERLLKRQQNRERMEEKRKQKAAQAEEQSHKKQKRGDSAGLDGPRAKEARKERKVLEKKMALNRRRKLDSRKEGEVLSKKKGDTGGESFRKVEVKSTTLKTPQPKLMRNLSESASSEDRHRRTSGSISEDSSETKKLCDKALTHSFILDLEQGSQEALKQRSGKFDRLSRKELHIKERKEKERSLSDERAKLKQKQEKKSEHQADEAQQKEGVKTSSEEKGEKKPKIKNEKKITANTREGKIYLSEGVADEGPKDVKKLKTTPTEAAKAEKDKEKDKTREKDKGKEKEKLKGEKISAKSDFKPLQRPESAGSSEDRSDMDPGSDSSKKKHSKEILKRSKSHSEDKQGDKPKPKTDSKDIDKEKIKADQDSQKSNKSSSETEKDPKRVKPTEKGTTVEKVKSKSKEETKTLLLSKTDKKVQSSEVRSVAGASTSKPEMTKEKKKERNAKEQRKVSEEPSHEKSEGKSGKKKLEKDKVPEKNSESQEEKKEPTEEKLERSDKSSVSSLSLETEDAPKKQPLLRDTSADSDPIATTVTTSFSDDTCDALSDITPEPPEGDADSRLYEVPAVPAQADALLTLMDVCTSAEARLPPECFREDVSSERALEDADMKMKEAALTLLSMDPDSTVPSSFIIHNTSDEPVENEAAPQLMQTPAVQEEQHLPVDVAAAAEPEFTTIEASPAPPPHTAELVVENPNTADNTQREMETSTVEVPETLAPQKCQESLEDEDKKAEILPEAPLKDEPSPPAADEEENYKGATEDNNGCVASSITEKVSETSLVSSKDEQTEPDVSDAKMSPKQQTEDVTEENLANANTDNSEAESTKVEPEHVSEMCEPQSMETSVPDQNEETSEGEPDMQSNLMKPVRSISSVDSQDNGSELSEKEEKTEGRGRRKRKLSGQKVAAVKEFSDEEDEKGNNEQPPAEETEQTQVVEVKTGRRRRSSQTTDETEKDQRDQLDEPSSHRGGRSGAEAEEAAADNQDKDENKQDESSSGEPADKEEEGIKEESTTKTSEEQGSQISLSTPVQQDAEAAGSSESENTAGIPQPTVKRRRSEEMEESVEETQADMEVKEADGQQEQSEQPPQTDMCGLSSGNQSEEQEDVKEESSIKSKTEEEQQQEDQEATPKRNVRRGRPPKAAAAAATEDSDKKDKKVERKESEQNDEEEEEDGEKEEEGKETATRATTRLASRLEAERNKPSKPSTRASRQSGKDETAAGTRGTRGQAAAAKGGRKREASPPAVRTRGGQKSEEPPSKRGKR